MAPAQITKQQNTRLRYYFERGIRCSKNDMDATDLDLSGLKLIEITVGTYSNQIKVTPSGIEAIHQYRQKTIATRNIHNNLGARLSEYLRKQGRITWENIEFKNRLTNPETGYEQFQCVRPDVFSILPSLQLKYANPCIHEVKVSRADFLGDIGRPEKREAYYEMSEAVYYTVPEGMVSPEEIPTGFGLMIETKNGTFKLVKKVRKRKVELKPHHYLNLIIKPGEYPADYGL